MTDAPTPSSRLPTPSASRHPQHRNGVEEPAFHSLGREPLDVAVGDLDGDQDLDVACTQRQDKVSILLNRSATPSAIGPQSESGALAAFGPADSNPARRSGTSIPYVLVAPAHVRIAVRDVAGRHVRLLFGGVRPAGRQSVTWDCRHDDGALVGGGRVSRRAEWWRMAPDHAGCGAPVGNASAYKVEIETVGSRGGEAGLRTCSVCRRATP